MFAIIGPFGVWEFIILGVFVALPAGLLWLVVRALWRVGGRK